MPRSLCVALGVLVVGGGCGTETGNPEGMSVELGYNARSSRPDVVGFDEGAEIVVDTVWLRLDAVTLTPCDGPEATFAGLGLADHGGVEAATQVLPVDSARFCGVSTRAAVAAPGPDEPEVVGGAAIVIEGRRGGGRPFVVAVDEPVDLGVLLDGAPPPSDGRWLLSFDVATWLDPDELGALPDASVEVGGTALWSLVDRLADGVSLHLDRDGDGSVDPGEERLDR